MHGWMSKINLLSCLKLTVKFISTILLTLNLGAWTVSGVRLYQTQTPTIPNHEWADHLPLYFQWKVIWHNPPVYAYNINGVPLNILSHRGQNDTSTKQAEGCFCPNGTMLYDSGVDVCVKTCGEFYCFPWMHVCFLFVSFLFMQHRFDCMQCSYDV